MSRNTLEITEIIFYGGVKQQQKTMPPKLEFRAGWKEQTKEQRTKDNYPYVFEFRGACCKKNKNNLCSFERTSQQSCTPMDIVIVLIIKNLTNSSQPEERNFRNASFHRFLWGFSSPGFTKQKDKFIARSLTFSPPVVCSSCSVNNWRWIFI